MLPPGTVPAHQLCQAAGVSGKIKYRQGGTADGHREARRWLVPRGVAALFYGPSVVLHVKAAVRGL